MQKLVIVGNLTSDPVSNQTKDGREVTNFTVAVNRRKTQQNQNPEADFFRVSAWDKLAKNCKDYLAKGRKVCVVGSVSVNTYTGQDGTTRASMNVMAQDVEFLTPKSESNDSAPAQSAPDPAVNMTPVDPGSELPF